MQYNPWWCSAAATAATAATVATGLRCCFHHIQVFQLGAGPASRMLLGSVKSMDVQCSKPVPVFGRHLLEQVCIVSRQTISIYSSHA